MTAPESRSPADDLLTVPEVARILRVCDSLAYRLCKEGTIPSARIASVGSRRGRVVVRRRDLDAYMERLFAGRREPGRIDVDAIARRVKRRHAQR